MYGLEQADAKGNVYPLSDERVIYIGKMCCVQMKGAKAPSAGFYNMTSTCPDLAPITEPYITEMFSRDEIHLGRDGRGR